MRKIISKKKHLDKIKEINNENKVEQFDHNVFSVNIRDSAGGTISNSRGAVVKSNYLNQWLVDTRQAMKNPFIGKSYMVKATEFEVADKVVVDETVTNASNELLKTLDDGMKPFDPKDIDNISDESDESESLRKDDTANRLIDHSIAYNMAKKITNMSDDRLLMLIKDEMKQYHGDENYEPTINVLKSIDKARQDLFITHEKPRLLT